MTRRRRREDRDWEKQLQLTFKFTQYAVDGARASSTAHGDVEFVGMFSSRHLDCRFLFS